MTSTGRQGDLVDCLPKDIEGLTKSIQGLMIHIFWLDRYGVKMPDARKAEVQIRPAAQKLERILKLDASSLESPRLPENRLVSNCRDFSVMLATVLRHQGIPARARCGFATYFQPEHFEDHWVCEYWNAKDGCWVMIDGQLDDIHVKCLNIDFDPLDVPHDRFIVAGKAWKMCRKGHADPHAFGIFDLNGLSFVRGNFVRDIASLNKVELLPWDSWGIMEARDGELTPDDLATLDFMADLTANDVDEIEKVWGYYQDDERFHVPATIRSYTHNGVMTVDLKNI